MRKLLFTLSLFIITFSLTRIIKADDGKNKQIDQGGKSAEEVNLDEVMAECNKSFTIAIAYIESLNSSGSFPDESDKTPKCYVRCVLENTGIMSSDGVFYPERVAVTFASEDSNEAEVQKAAITCAERSESCKCEKAYNFMKCLVARTQEKRETKVKIVN